MFKYVKAWYAHSLGRMLSRGHAVVWTFPDRLPGKALFDLADILSPL